MIQFSYWRNYSLMIALLFMSQQSQAQKKLRIGVKVGAGISSVTNSSIKDLKLMFASADGIMVNYAASEILSFQGEALFSKKGYAQKLILIDNIGLAYSTTAYRVASFYFEVPLLVKIKTKGESTKVRFFANAGISPAFNIASTAKYNDGEKYITLSGRRPHTFDIGAIGSVGIEYNIASLPSFIELRINNGFSKIYDNSNAKNITYMLSTGISF